MTISAFTRHPETKKLQPNTSRPDFWETGFNDREYLAWAVARLVNIHGDDEDDKDIQHLKEIVENYVDPVKMRGLEAKLSDITKEHLNREKRSRELNNFLLEDAYNGWEELENEYNELLTALQQKDNKIEELTKTIETLQDQLTLKTETIEWVKAALESERIVEDEMKEE